MTSRRKINKRWMRWSRYVDHIIGTAGDGGSASRGMERAYNRMARAFNGRRSAAPIVNCADEGCMCCHSEQFLQRREVV